MVKRTITDAILKNYLVETVTGRGVFPKEERVVIEMEAVGILKKLARGSRVSLAKLNELQACKVMARWLMGARISQIARECGVSRTAVRSLLQGNTWVHVFQETAS